MDKYSYDAPPFLKDIDRRQYEDLYALVSQKIQLGPIGASTT